MATRTEVEAVFKMRDQLSGQLKVVSRNLEKLQKETKKSGKELQQVAKNTSFKSLTGSIIGANVAMAAFRTYSACRGWKRFTTIPASSARPGWRN